MRFVPLDFTPQKPYPYGGLLCHGVHILVLDRNVLDAPELGLEIASALHRLYPQQFALDKINTLLANGAVLGELATGDDPERIAEGWRPAVEAFEKERAKALLY